MAKMKVGLIFGGNSPEHEISIMSAKSVFEAADKDKYDIIPIAISKSGKWLSAENSKKVFLKQNQKLSFQNSFRIEQSLISFLNYNFDVVFPLIHGPNGEDGKLQGFFELLDLPYVGTGVLSSALGMDKAFAKKIFSYHNLTQGKFIILTDLDYKKHKFDFKKEINDKINYPCFVKPANMGSSIGISKVDNSQYLIDAINNAFKFDNKIVIEEFINGREIECSVLGNDEIEVSLPGEIKAGHDFYDYEAKYKDKSTELLIPASLSENIIKKLQNIAVKAFKAIDGRGLARIDFFVREKDDKIFLNEINTIPGFTEYSMYPKLWEVTGKPYSELIDDLIELAIEK